MRVNAFSKSYGDRKVLQMPEMEFDKGNIYAVIGANGSGKSTLAKILAGIEPAHQNAAVWQEKIKIGYLPQRPYAFKISMAANICLGSNDRAKADKLMDFLQISHLAKQKALSLSGGETARMFLARVMMKNWQLLILDEPTAAMDISSTALAEDLIKEYCQKQNCVVLLITHSLQQAKRIADHVLFLHNNQLWESGPCRQILTCPSRPETRQFLDFYGM